MKLNAHLVFSSTCEQAFNTYKEVLNAKIAYLLRKGDDPDFGKDSPEKDEISYMVLVKDQFMIGGNDACKRSTVTEGNNTKLVLTLDTAEESETVFKQLAQDGNVTMPLQKVHFCEKFGELTDKFGISWIIMVESKQS